MFRQIARPSGDRLDRSRPGHRRAGRTVAGNRGPRPDSRADPHRGAAARSTRPAQADQPAQRVPAHRHRGLHEARRDRVIGSACRHTVVRGGRADVGTDPGRGAPDSAADAFAAGRALADGGRIDASRQDAGHPRVRADRKRRGRLRQGVRHASAGLGTRAVPPARAVRRLRRRAVPASALRDERRRVAPSAPGSRNPRRGDGGRPSR